jgi:hypothetical protein
MVKRTKLIVLNTFLLVTCSLYLPAKPNDLIPYPMGYRQWVHVMSALVGPESPFFKNSGGIHHIYANDKAMEGYKSGRFPDGSIIVADFLETQESKGITTEGPRRRIDVMLKDGNRYTETGGWGFEQFRGDSQIDRMVTAEIAAKCFACHVTQKEHDSVFSKYRK